MFWVPLLMVAWVVAATSCVRLCLAASRAAEPAGAGAAERPGRGHALSLYEAAFLSGGPYRVADLTLVSMARQRRLLLAHTGWATVVDPTGHDEMERSVLGAIAPTGAERIAPIRTSAAAADSVRALAEHLVAVGLAVPHAARSTVAGSVRQVKTAALAVLGLGAVAALMSPDGQGGSVAVWFALPLILTLGCLAIARFEVHPYTRWASPAGQRLLGSLAPNPAGDDRAYLTTVAVRGVQGIRDPELRAAFSNGKANDRAHGEGSAEAPGEAPGKG